MKEKLQNPRFSTLYPKIPETPGQTFKPLKKAALLKVSKTVITRHL